MQDAFPRSADTLNIQTEQLEVLEKVRARSDPDQTQIRPRLSPDQTQIRPRSDPDQAQIRPRFSPDQTQIRPRSDPEPYQNPLGQLGLDSVSLNGCPLGQQ